MATATQLGVTFHPGERFVRGSAFPHSARLCFAHCNADELVQGVRRLAVAIGLRA